ncbi:MAG: ATP-grasp domain-containing protein [bacterium]|nr:ATP-grasp domain-containing protein [bacterium]
MPVLILPPRYTEDSIIMWRTANAEGWTTHRVQGWRIEEHFSADQAAIYGEPLFAATIAQQLSLVLMEPPFSFLSVLPKEFTKRLIQFGTFDLLSEISYPSFIKPADDKCFPAKVYDRSGDIPGLELLERDTPILVSEPVHWESEFRGFILNGQCVTFSVYARNGKSAEAKDGSWPCSGSELKEAQDFFDSLLNDPRVLLPPATVVDIGVISGKGWAVVEANPCWGSGVYGCEPKRVLETVARACLPKDSLSEEMAPWIIPGNP